MPTVNGSFTITTHGQQGPFAPCWPQPRYNRGQPYGRRFRLRQFATPDYRGDQAGVAVDRHQLSVSVDHRQDRIRAQSVGAGVDLDSQGPVPVYRPDLARHGEAGRRFARLWPICRRHHQDFRRPLHRGRPDRARRDHETAQRPGSQRDDGRRLLSLQCLPADWLDRPPPDRGRALHRAFSRARRRRQDDQRRRLAAGHQCRQIVSVGGRR